MTESLSQIIYYINSILFLAMSYYGFTRVFKPAVPRGWILLAYIAFLIIASQQFFILDNAWVNLLLNIAAFMLISFLFSGTLSARLVFASLIHITSVAADAISFTGISYIYYAQHGIELPSVYTYSFVRTASNIIFLLLFLICILLFKKYLSNKLQSRHFKVPAIYTMSVFLMLAGVILIDALFLLVAIKEVKKMAGQIIVVQFIVLLVIFLIIWFYNAILDYLQALELGRQRDQQLERWEAQYKVATFSQNKVLELNHNLRYHFVTLGGYLKDRDIAKAEQHLQQKLGDISEIVNTGNMPIDAMLSYYQQQVKDILGIEMETELQIPPDMKLDADLVATVLGNALDNAIEACVQVAPSLRYINFRASIAKQKANETLLIVITNPYATAPITDSEGNLLTTKPDKYKHGLGLSSVQEIISGGNGHINFDFRDNRFRFMLVLYNVLDNSCPLMTFDDPLMTLVE